MDDMTFNIGRFFWWATLLVQFYVAMIFLGFLSGLAKATAFLFEGEDGKQK